ncbi:MAG TPA: hypothetical protein VHU60_03300, partial [Gaiellaceae bacterium]|nr:hypothetical protein [Gaiellaceae bacterium]
FGAIFANRLRSELAAKFPTGVHIPAQANPEVVKHLPAAVHTPYIEAFAAALRPVFLTATGIIVFAFMLTWLLREVPLRQTSADVGAAESIPLPSAGDVVSAQQP